MRRVMIIGQPGSGKSTLARRLGELTYLPVFHMDHIHWESGWVERDRDEKMQMALEVIEQPAWIFEGGHSKSSLQRLARADTLIWLDMTFGLRARRVLWRTVRHYGRTRPDLPAGCPEQVSLEFWSWIWRTRHTGRAAMKKLYESTPPDKTRHHFTTPHAVNTFLAHLGDALAVGNLGIPHR